jgi:hypothetical protein
LQQLAMGHRPPRIQRQLLEQSELHR